MEKKKATAEMLSTMLRDHAAALPECKECYIGRVAEIQPDDSVCNWKISKVQGSHCIECLEAMADFIRTLRAGSIIDDVSDMDPTLLTTWAMR